MTYRADIDGLRAIAVWLVIAFHFLGDASFGGYTGVDIFFVISGYLITKIIYAEVQNETFSLLNFYERRARRILPALTAVLLASSLAAYALFLPEELMAFGKSLIATTLFSSNFLFWSEAGYFDISANLKPLLHTWSLAIEEQFYIFFPLIMMACYRFARSKLKLIIAVLFLLSFGANITFIALDTPESAFYMLPARAWELLTGSLLALNCIPSIKNKHITHFFSWGGMALIITGCAISIDEKYFPGFYALLPTLGTALIIYTGQHTNETGANSFLSRKGFTFMGKISYSLYLWHWPVFIFGQYYFLDDLSITMKLILITACVALSYLSWLYIEQPFRRKKIIPIRTALFQRAALCILVFIGCGMFLLQTHGAAYKYDPETLQILDVTMGDSYPSAKNHPLPNTSRTFGATDDHSQASIVIWGDSHAQAIAPALALLAEQNGTTGLLLTQNGCLMPSSFYPELQREKQCTALTDKTLAYLNKADHIKTVILVQRWADRLRGWYGKDESKTEKRRKILDLREISLLSIINQLEQAGKKVLILAQIPEVEHDSQNIPSVVVRTELYNLDTDLRPKLATYFQHQKYIFPIFENLTTQTGVQIIWPHKALCDETRCKIRDGNRLYYYDDDHLSKFGAEQLAFLFEDYYK